MLQFSFRATSLALALPLFCITPANAQVLFSGKSISLNLATEVAREAIAQCEAGGYKVSASVVDVAGVERVFLRGDHSTIHTRETAFKKAYTEATLGPIFGASTTGQLVEKLSQIPTAAGLTSVTNVIMLAGGVAIRSNGEIIGAIGVGGAPGGHLDEACALAAVSKIQARLDALEAPKVLGKP
ncbi:MAG: heme-binding protein [Burkholderiaceae bacterium]|nr:heme-binding protein [Burkholderiaceae bacterium]